MAQHDQVIGNDIGLPVREDINAALAAAFSSSSGATEPAVKVPGQLWFDTSSSSLKVRNAANDSWHVVVFTFSVDGYYTKAEMDARFQSGPDTYTISEADSTFRIAGESYTKVETDARLNPLADPRFATASAPTKKAHFDVSPIAAGQDRALRIPNLVTTLGYHELIWDEEIPAGGVIVREFKDLGAFETLELLLEWHAVSVSTASPHIHFSTDNGATYDSTASYYNWILYSNGTQVAAGGVTSGATGIYPANNNTIPAGLNTYGIGYDAVFGGFNKPRWSRGRAFSGFGIAGNIAYAFGYMSGHQKLVPRNAMRIISSDGAALWTGHITLHGIRG
jgi:hypothetical protein